MLLLEIEDGLGAMERSFIQSDLCNRISYKGQCFTHKNRMENEGTRVSLTCTSCGENFTSNLVNEETRFENFDLILMYMLGDSYCRCDCDKSMYNTADTNNTITTTANIDPSVEEGERIPRVN